MRVIGKWQNIMLSKGNKKVEFDKLISMTYRAIYVYYFCQGHEFVTESRTKMRIQCVHELFGKL